MCTQNTDIATLKKLRAKGHVLIPVYKYRSDRIYHYPFCKGWNIARCPKFDAEIALRTKPFPKGTMVNESFHFYLKEINDGVYRQTFWIYADEITACGFNIMNQQVLTCSRAFIKQLNKRFIY